MRSTKLDLLMEENDGVLFQRLPALVAKHLGKRQAAELGSVSWYTTTVKLNLEVEGETEEQVPEAALGTVMSRS